MPAELVNERPRRKRGANPRCGASVALSLDRRVVFPAASERPEGVGIRRHVIRAQDKQVSHPGLERADHKDLGDDADRDEERAALSGAVMRER